MSLESALDKVHSKIVADRRLQIFTAATRLLLAIGFIPPSIPKILHKPFTLLPESNPVGAYFGALYRTGFYYEFIGWSQIIAAVLLLYPRTSHLGAMMFLPIIANIAILTISVGFKGTWLVTSMMFLAALYLVCWDYDKWKSIFWKKREVSARLFPKEFVLLPVVFAAAGIAVSAAAYAINLSNLRAASWKLPVALAVAGGVFGLLTAIHHRMMKTAA